MNTHESFCVFAVASHLSSETRRDPSELNGKVFLFQNFILMICSERNLSSTNQSLVILGCIVIFNSPREVPSSPECFLVYHPWNGHWGKAFLNHQIKGKV